MSLAFIHLKILTQDNPYCRPLGLLISSFLKCERCEIIFSEVGFNPCCLLDNLPWFLNCLWLSLHSKLLVCHEDSENFPPNPFFRLRKYLIHPLSFQPPSFPVSKESNEIYEWDGSKTTVIESFVIRNNSSKYFRFFYLYLCIIPTVCLALNECFSVWYSAIRKKKHSKAVKIQFY